MYRIWMYGLLCGVALSINSMSISAASLFEPINSEYFPQISLSGLHPNLADIDGDGDFDIVIGRTSRLYYYENIGNTSYLDFEQRSNAQENLFYNIANQYRYVSPRLIDFDGDHDLDLVAGEENGTIIFYENTGTNTQAIFVQRSDTSNPFAGIDVGSYSVPALGDIDGDGDIDAFIGGQSGDVKFYQNTGTISTSSLTEITDSEHPLNNALEIQLSGESSPSLVDFDRDGDLDIFIGDSSKQVYYYKNIGTPTNPEYQQQFGAQNPF